MPQSDDERQARETRARNSRTMNDLLRARFARRQQRATLHGDDPAFSQKLNAGIRRALGRAPAEEGTDYGD